MTMKAIRLLMAGIVTIVLAGCTQLDANRSSSVNDNDQDLTSEVSRKLAADPLTSHLRLGVAAEDGVVTLSGRIDNPTVRLRALSIARSVPGVRDVNDQTIRY